MILPEVKNLDIQRVGDLDGGNKASISEESLPFVFNMVSKNLYSNPIGSIVREITSNCFDSHIEAGIEDPVIISKTYSSEEGYSIEFKDVGIGMSPETMNKIYNSWFSSTKRNSNELIGSFGIGSKTPLSYADLFYITTIYNGIKYEYVYHTGEKLPELESLLGYDEVEEVKAVWNEELELEEEVTTIKRIPIGEPTEERNGTTIKIVIDNSHRAYPEKQDLEKFKDELKFQLTYFDNTYFQNWGISNDYDIYEGEYFKFRSDMEQDRSNVHLCIGKVRYPIDFNMVKVAKEFQSMPVAVKFNIGELDITPSREAIRYTPETSKIIEERIKLAANEIIELFESQNPIVEDLSEYISLMNDKAKITFDKEKKHYLYLWSYAKMERGFKFRPIAHLPIKKTPKKLFFMWEIIGTISGNGFRSGVKYDRQIVDNELIKKGHYIIATKEDKPSSYTDIYISQTIASNGIDVIRRRDIEFEDTSIMLGIKESKEVRKAKVIYEYLKTMDKIVKDNGYKYLELRPTDEWIANYKRSIKESSAAYKRRVSQKVFVRDITHSGAGKEVKVSELEVRTGILVYGFKEDKNKLQAISDTVLSHKSSIRKIDSLTRRDKAFLVFQISRSVEKDIQPLRVFDKKKGKWKPVKTIYYEDFLKTKFFRKIVTSKYIYDELDNLTYQHDLKRTFLRDYKQAHSKVLNSIVDYKSGKSYYGRFEGYDIPLISEMLKPLEDFRKYANISLPLAGALSSYIDKEATKEVAEYYKFKEVQLPNKFYLKDRRQLQYEANLKKILKEIKNPITNLLTYTLKQENNVSTEQDNEEDTDDL